MDNAAKTVFAILSLAVLGCASEAPAPTVQVVDSSAPEFVVVVDEEPRFDPEPQAPLTVPQIVDGESDTSEGETAPVGLLGRSGGPILPLMPADQLQIAVDLANEQLEESGYTVRVQSVPTYQGSVEDVSFYAQKEAYGWTPGKVVFVGTGEVCGSPGDYNGKRLGWILSHELLHTVGFDHGPEMKKLTDDLGARWREFCGPLVQEDVKVEMAGGCMMTVRHCYDTDNGPVCVQSEDFGIEVCGNGEDDNCDGQIDEDRCQE